MSEAAEAVRNFAAAFDSALMSEVPEIRFSDRIDVSAIDLLASVDDELSLHLPELDDHRRQYLAEQIVTRAFADMRGR